MTADEVLTELANDPVNGASNTEFFTDAPGDGCIGKTTESKTMLTKDDIPRLRAEAKQFRDYAKHQRAEAAKCKSSGDWVGKLKANTRATEHVRVAQDRDQAIKALKAA